MQSKEMLNVGILGSIYLFPSLWPNVLADEEIAGELLDVAQRKREEMRDRTPTSDA